MSQNFLKQIREEKSFGQAELARKAGVSKQLIWGFENGKNGVSSEVLRKLAEVLKVTPNYITKGSDVGSPLTEEEKKRMFEAMKITHEYYKDYGFDYEMMSKIATEMYGFMSDFEKLKEQIGSNSFDKSLNEKIASGLAAKCFLSFKDSEH
jgi:transcriptional regulator with XRE-family HTH domain